MAPRIMKRTHDQFTRDRIRTTQLVMRLTDHVLKDTHEEIDYLNPRTGKWTKKKLKVDLLSASQVSAALGLIKKTLPDLAAHTIEGNPDAPVVHEIRRTIVDPALDAKPVTADAYFHKPTDEAVAAENAKAGHPVVRRIVG